MKTASIVIAIAHLLISPFASADDDLGVGQQADEVWNFKLSINGQKSPTSYPVTLRDGKYYLSADTLKAFGVSIARAEASIFDLDPSAKVNKRQLRIDFSVDPSYFGQTRNNFQRTVNVPVLENQLGGWLNYDVHLADYGKGAFIQGYADLNLSTKYGTLNSQFAYSSVDNIQPLRRVRTVFRVDDRESMRTLEIGDVTSSTAILGGQVRLLGAKISRNFQLRPDYSWLPSFVISGQAKSPSTLEIWEGSVKTYSKSIQPGIYSVDNYLPFSGNGNVNVIVKDAFGQESIISHPIYTSPQLLADGVDAYSAEIGLIKNNVSYQHPYFSIDYRRGFDVKKSYLSVLGSVIPNITLEGRIEGKKKDVRFGLGASFANMAGSFNLTKAIGSSNGAPSITTASWEKNIDFGTYGSVSAFASTTKHQNLTSTNEIPSGSKSAQYTTTGITYTPISSLTLNLTSISSETNGSKGQIGEVGLTKRFANGSSLSFQLSKTSEKSGVNAWVNFNIPLGANGCAYGNGAKGGASFGYAATAGENSELRYGISTVQNRTEKIYQGDIAAEMRYGKIDGIFNQTPVGATKQTTYRVGGSGSVSYADGNVWFGKWVNQSLVIADTGVPNINVLANNREVGTTNSDGKLAITDLPSWRNNKIAVGANLGNYTKNRNSTAQFTPQTGGVGFVKLSLDEPGYSIFVAIDGKPLGDMEEVKIDGVAYPYNPYAGAYVSNSKVGKRSIVAGGCVSDIDVPVLDRSKRNTFEFNICEKLKS